MPYKADAMAVMRKGVPFQSMVLHVDFCCLVYSPTFYSRSEGLESRSLRLQHHREVLFGLRGWFSNYDRSFELAGVAADFNSSLTHQYISTPDPSSGKDCMRYRGFWPDLSTIAYDKR